MRFVMSFIFSICAIVSFSQNVTGERVQANKNLLPPLDTFAAPYRVGEIRTKVSGGDTLLFLAVSLSADKKWYAYPKSSSSPAGTTVVRDSVLYCNLLKFGFVPDNSTDNTPIFNALYNAGWRNFFLPPTSAGVKMNTTTVKIDSVHFWGDGLKSLITISAVDTVFQIGKYCVFENITIQGTSNIGQVGISLDSSWGNIISKVRFRNLGSNIYSRANGLDANNFTVGNLIDGCFSEGHKRGAYLDVRAEYHTFSNCSFNKGDTGIVISGGNNNVIGGKYNSNVVGGRWTGGANNAHSNIVGTQFNHNTSRSVIVDGVTLGLDFSSTQHFYGSMDIIGSTRVTFTNPQIEFVSTDSLRWNTSTGAFIMGAQPNPPSGRWVVTGTPPTVLNYANTAYGISMVPGGGTSSLTITNQAGVVTYGGTVQQHKFSQNIVTSDANYIANRTLAAGASDFNYGGSGTYADMVQMFTTGANTTAVLGIINTAGGYSARFHKLGNVWFGGRTATNTVPTASIHIVAGTATASTAPLKFTAGAILTVAESGVIETDGGNNLFYTNATAVRGRLQQNRTLTSAAGTLSITDNYNHYVFTGSTSTWTLPAVSGTANVIYYIKNRGSGVLTINTTSGNEIYETAAVATINVSAGAALVLFSDGTYYNVE